MIVNPMLIAITFLVICSETADAQDRKTPYCNYKQAHAPHGVALRIGARYYRICMNWTENDYRGRAVGLWIDRIDPSQFPKLFSSTWPRYVSHYMTIRERNPNNSDWLSRLIENPRNVRIDPFFGPTTYETYARWHPEKPDKIAATLSVYWPDATSDVPFHWVACNGWASFEEEGGDVFCNLIIQNNDVYVGIQYNIENTPIGREFLDHFTDFATDMAKVLDALDVTDRAEELSNMIDFVD